ncbi:MFS transporter [Gemmatirosa kalamazoonensis]|uniref:MFS transporter n=1 Tax=Gemmatirosa kalamazoonensis TaxID=861299 RepID=UPI00046D7E4A|nr:MFS transporter [Gemmatirosa kalamazoonensis]
MNSRRKRTRHAQTGTAPTRGALSLDGAAGRWVVAAAVLGSSAVFLEGTVVNVALPPIGRDLGFSLAALQWLVDGYLLTLSALMLLGGALGDRYDRRRVFAVGCVAFGASCACAALAPTAALLLLCRVVQGAAGALLVPNSLALLETSFREADRGRAIGHWTAWSAVSTAAGPFAGGGLLQIGSWRWVFATIVPVALAAAWAAWRHVAPAARREGAAPSVDVGGALLATLGLAGTTWALIEGPTRGVRDAWVLGAVAIGVGALVAFVVAERRVAHPLLPLSIFRSRQFSGANGTTLLVYAALGGLFFLLMLELQNVLGYGPLAAGTALLPLNALMLLVSPRAGKLAQRIGPRLPMTVGSLVAAVGMLLFARVGPGAHYVDTVLPAILVFGVGLSVLVAPLTAAVLGAVDDELAGVASALNNAVARLAGLLAIAALPIAAGFGAAREASGRAFAAGFSRAMVICAGLCAAGAVVAWATVRRGRRAA